MTKAELKKIVDKRVRAVRVLLGVGDWNITYAIGKCDGRDRMAEIDITPKYRSAKITFDPDMHDDEGEVIDSVRHELLHVVLAPYDKFRSILFNGCGGALSDNMVKVLDEAFDFAAEEAVHNIEYMLDTALEIPESKFKQIPAWLQVHDKSKKSKKKKK